MATATTPTTVDASFGYTLSEDVTPDTERPGLLRARTRAETDALDGLDLRTFPVHDLAATPWTPHLVRNGFEHVMLPQKPELRSVLQRVKDQGELLDADREKIRRNLTGARLRLADGSRLVLVFIAPEGQLMRSTGPNRMDLSGRDVDDQHGGADSVHADQDILGTPLKQMMRGVAPRLFRHDAPDSRNRRSPLMLVNLWMPLQQVTRPLAFMDTDTLDRQANQLRYAEPVGDFLDRDEKDENNDTWNFSYDARQRWYFNSEASLGSAYVFDTLGTPHGAFVLPGEDVAARRVTQLDAVIAALSTGDLPAAASLKACESAILAGATVSLRRAVQAMEGLLAEVAESGESIFEGSRADDWIARARVAQAAVVRKSVELRVVALRIPSFRRVPAFA